MSQATFLLLNGMGSGTGADGIGGAGAGNAASAAGSVSDVSDAIGFADGGRASVPLAVFPARAVLRTMLLVQLPLDRGMISAIARGEYC
ncbi:MULTISPECIES: hypothetical protein [unclassified Microcoleus]|uniref:hypothetical protein n=1 Tax=unclassified Microcoleus TaxID=2642155 RepID=UPI002FD642EB